ncbi:MAG: HAD family hydrolase [Phycisphaerales bacterium]|nr:HAD family hydrolase [Phycisphaerales bacterium]
MPNHAPAQPIRLLVLDVDGVLTDGGISLDDLGRETKRFHVRDGAGIRMWLTLGLEIAIITGRSGMVVHHRARELGIRHVVTGSKAKAEAFAALCAQLEIAPSEAAMLGDDIPDLSVLRACGFPMAVQDASAEVLAFAQLVTQAKGGHGAVREAIEYLLRAQGRWQEAVRVFDPRFGGSDKREGARS